MKIKNEKLVSILFNLIIILTYFIAFDRFINVILTTLTKEEKDYIFKKELVKESVFKKVK